MTRESLLRLADAVLIPPFPGLKAPRWILDALERGLGGVTIYGQNVLGDTAALTSTLLAASPGAIPVIAIDEEGGDVTRIAYALGSPYPGNAALGAVDDVGLTEAVHYAIGRDLVALGVNVNLAPCADVLGDVDSPAIGTRSFGSSTDLVARHTAGAVRGLQAAGVAACAKHFPGHGSTGSADSHLELVTVSGSMAVIRERDLPPFTAAIQAGAAAVLPGHLRVPELTGDRPATLSAAAVTGLLRGELGFTGVIISDALEMQAIKDTYGIPGGAVLAIAAGVDLLCFGQDTDEAMYHAVREAIADAVLDGTLPLSRLENAAERVAALRASFPIGSTPNLAAANGIGLTAARRAIRLSGPRPRLTDPVIVEVEPRENIAAGPFAWGLSPWASPGSVRRVDAADGSDASGIVAAAAGRSLVVAVRDAHVDKRTLALIMALLTARPDTVLVEMGLPHWSPPEGTACLATFGASRACAQAAAELLGLTG